MRKVIWVGLGVLAGALVARRASELVGRDDAGGLASAIADARVGMRDLAVTIREGMSEREAELRVALGLDSPPLPDAARLDPQHTRDLLRDPAGWRARQG